MPAIGAAPSIILTSLNIFNLGETIVDAFINNPHLNLFRTSLAYRPLRQVTQIIDIFLAIS